MFAGHEANANTLTLAIFLLACYPQIQQAVQEDIDRFLNRRSMSQTSYQTDFPLLKESLVGAVINETLRLFTVLPFLPKSTPETSQTIYIKGQHHLLPAKTLILINTSATHRHPKYWPSPQGPLGGKKPHPVSSFNPGYWLQRQSERGGDKFLRPKAGSFIPFSDGGRGCLGRQFAMVELCAQLMRIFAEYSVHLVVEGRGATAGGAEGTKAWEEVRRRAEDQMSQGVVFDMTLRPKEMVPVRFLRRQNVHVSL